MATLLEVEMVLLPFYGKMLLLGGGGLQSQLWNPAARPSVLWHRFSTFGRQGYRRAIKQAPHALWMLHSPENQAANIAGTPCGGPGIIISTLPRILRTLWKMGDNLLAKKSLGEG